MRVRFLNQRLLTLLVAAGMVGLLAGSAAAQAPTITSLFPAGLQQGTTAEIGLNGKPGKLPLSAVALDADQLQLTVSEKGDKLSVVATEKTTPGIHWIRFYNNDGSNKLLPLHVGVLPEVQEKEPNNSLKEVGDPLPLPVVVNGVLNKGGEIDQFPVTLNKGETLVASLDAHRSLGSPMDSALQLVDAQGFIVEQNHDDHGSDPLIAWTAAATGNYSLRIFAFPSAPNSSISYAGGGDYVYRLTLTTGPFLAEGGSQSQPGITPAGWNLQTYTPGADLSFPGLHLLAPPELQTAFREAASPSPQPLTLPIAVRETLRSADSSIPVGVTLEKGNLVRVQVAARSIDSLLDPVLQIREGDKVHKEVDDIAKDKLDIDFVWKAPAAGNYSFVVSDRYQHAGPRYFYLLKLTPEEPRFEATVAQELFVGKADQALEIPITISRLNGFAEALRFRVVGLNEQQTVEAVVSEPKGDSAKSVTLKITNTAPDLFQGTVKIMAEWGTESPPQQPVTTTLILPDYSTDQLWLTLPATAKPSP